MVGIPSSRNIVVPIPGRGVASTIELQCTDSFQSDPAIKTLGHPPHQIPLNNGVFPTSDEVGPRAILPSFCANIFGAQVRYRCWKGRTMYSQLRPERPACRCYCHRERREGGWSDGQHACMWDFNFSDSYQHRDSDANLSFDAITSASVTVLTIVL